MILGHQPNLLGLTGPGSSRGRVVPVTECWMCWAVFRRNHRRRSGHLLSVRSSRAMLAVPSGGEDGHVGSLEQALSHC
jgi:hypothetical protein